MTEPPFDRNRRWFLKIARELEQLVRDANYHSGLPIMANETLHDVEDARIAAAIARQGVAACDRRDWPAVCETVKRLRTHVEENGWSEEANSKLSGETES